MTSKLCQECILCFEWLKTCTQDDKVWLCICEARFLNPDICHFCTVVSIRWQSRSWANREGGARFGFHLRCERSRDIAQVKGLEIEQGSAGVVHAAALVLCGCVVTGRVKMEENQSLEMEPRLFLTDVGGEEERSGGSDGSGSVGGNYEVDEGVAEFRAFEFRYDEGPLAKEGDVLCMRLYEDRCPESVMTTGVLVLECVSGA